MDLIEQIGPVAGLVAFVGLAVLAFLIFQQSRDMRRLREWAGRAPERAKEAHEATVAAAEARGEAAGEPQPGRLGRLRNRIAGVVGPPLHAIDRNLPIDGRILLAILVAGAVAAGVLTGGFGLIGGDDGRLSPAERKERRAEKRERERAQNPDVAVLNATQEIDSAGIEVDAVGGLATKVGTQVVKPAGYRVTRQTDAPTGFPNTVIMHRDGEDDAAATFAKAIEEQLGKVDIEPITTDIEQRSGGAGLVLIVGSDKQGF
jgi:hypothetical protein